MNIILYFIVSALLLGVVGFLGVAISGRSPSFFQHEFFIAAFMAVTMYGQNYYFGWYV